MTMTRARIAQVTTLAILLVVLGIAFVRNTSARHQENAGQDPQDAIYAMLAAARAGDVKGYLARFTDPMESALRQTVAENSEPGFKKYLRDSNASIKGVALSDPEKIGDLETKVRVEYVYQDRNSTQIVYLVKRADGWKISGTTDDARIKTQIPYGTPLKR
jgi:hypothetical protein